MGSYGGTKARLAVCVALMACLVLPCALAFPRASADARAIAELERLQAENPAQALTAVNAAIANPSTPIPVYLEAIGIRCWLLANQDLATAGIQATKDLADTKIQSSPEYASGLHTCRGYTRHYSGDYTGAAQDFDRALALATKAKSKKAIAEAAVLRGELRYYFGDPQRALQDLQRAYRIQSELGEQGSVLYALTAIANVYADQRVAQYDKAIEYYRQILAMHTSAGKLREMSTAHFNIASTLERKGDVQAAVQEYRKSLTIETHRADAAEIATVQRALAGALVKIGRAAEALPLLDSALATQRAAKSEADAAAVQLTRGIALRALGRFDEAMAALDMARGYFLQAKNDRFLERIEGERASVFAAKSNWRAAFDASTSHEALTARLAKAAGDDATARMRVAFDTEKTEAANRALVRESRLRAQALKDAERITVLQRWAIGCGIAVLILIVAVALQAARTARSMRDLALTDELTRLPNRRRLFQVAEQEATTARAQNGAWCLLALDIDHFKRVNDTYGHDAGDRVLVRVARACEAAVRSQDVVGRTGGEEFLVVLPGASMDEAGRVAERIRASVAALDLDDISNGLRTSVSIGLARRRKDDQNVSDLVRRADLCLYEAKAQGRNQVVAEAV